MTKTWTLYKAAYAGLSKQTWLLSLVMLINRSGTMVVPFMTIYLTQRLRYSIAEAGYIMGIYGIGSVMGALLGGRLTDRIGFYAVQLAALWSGGIMFIVLGQVTSFSGLAICTFVLSLLNESFRPANATAIAAYSNPATVTRSFSLNRLSINLGWAAGGALGGLVASFNYSWLFWIDGLTNISAGILLVVFLPHSAVKKFLRKPGGETAQPPGSSAFQDGKFLYFLLLTTLFAICFFQLFTLLPVYFKQELRLSVSMIGALMAINGLLLASTEMLIVHQLEGKRPLTWYISAGVGLTGLSYLILNAGLIPPLGMALISVLLITLGEILAMPFMNSFWIARTRSQNRGQYASLYTISYSVAQIIAPALGSQLVSMAGFEGLWWIIGGLGCADALLFRYMKKEPVAANILQPGK